MIFHCLNDIDTIIQCAKIANNSILPNFSGIFFEKIGARRPKRRQNGGIGSFFVAYAFEKTKIPELERLED